MPVQVRRRATRRPTQPIQPELPELTPTTPAGEPLARETPTAAATPERPRSRRRPWRCGFCQTGLCQRCPRVIRNGSKVEVPHVRCACPNHQEVE